ncbi:MAG: hypothetical protein M9964_07735 [Solirubrobacterales bacterium]|nr:hypothetical protein [Thermoleophilales bacterium]MCO5326934.1 hypothetical protein [Solirubrobacterales bacterium]
MKTASRLLAVIFGVFIAIALTGALVANAADSGVAAKKAKVKLKVSGKGQTTLLKKGIKVKVTVKSKKKVKTKLKATSTTFDDPAAKSLAKTKKVTLKPKKKKGKGKGGKNRKGGGKKLSKTVKLKLTSSGKDAVSSCEARTITVKAGKSKTSFDLVRDTADCKPGTVDLSRASECDFIGNQDQSMCMVPFPDDFYTRSDADSATGRRIDFKTSAMPANDAGVHIAADSYNLNDGFSPGETIVVRIPGINTQADLDANNHPQLAQLGTYADADTSFVVIDAQTGERQPIWAEIDSNSTDPNRTAVLIHPSVNFASGHRYIVAIRNLKSADGTQLPAPAGFRYYRDDLPSDEAAINDQRDRFDGIFDKLKSAGIKRNNLYLAWDFTVATDENIAGRVMKMRDESFADLGDSNLADGVVTGDAPNFTVTTVNDYPTPGDNANIARRIRGTFEVPCYLTGGSPVPCGPGATMPLDSNGMPSQQGTYDANFDCVIPRAAVDGGTPTPARPSVYGHGLLGSASEANSSNQTSLARGHNIISCATDELGLSGADVPTAFAALGELGQFPKISDRLQQGLLNELLLGRLLVSPDGFVTDGEFHVDRTTGTASVIDPAKLYYNGNSQGGIMGGAFMALSPDATRGSLGVPGMNYSVLLNRSVDFDTYAEAGLNPNYTDMLERPLVLSMIQMLWDRGEANGYAHRMTTNPLPNTPQHKVLMNVAFGDHQVSNFTADTEARTIGAEAHAPVVDDGRWPGVDQLWNIPRISSYPFTGSAIVYWDSGPTRDDPGSADPAELLGTDPPPLANVPNRSGEDPHSLPRRTSEEQQMVSDFLQPDGLSNITDTCIGSAGPACHDYTFGGTRAPGS